MRLFHFFKGLFGNTTETTSIEINPASGLPMAGEMFDSEGNVYGSSSSFDSIHHCTDNITTRSSFCNMNNDISTSLLNDDWCGGSGINDDSFGSCFSD